MSTDKNQTTTDYFSIIRHRSPYPGLHSFLEDEQDLFFGRDKQIEDIVDQLTEKYVAAILGGSGCG